MKQHRRHSFLEASLNTGIGFVISLIANILILPLFGLHPTYLDSVNIGLVFTLISIVRSYFVRRLFVELHHREIL